MMEKISFEPEKAEIYLLKRKSDEIIGVLKEEILKNKIDADVFLGGSLAKGTLVKSEDYDIDIFVRFDWKYEELSDRLEKILSPVSRKLKVPLEKVHGSRDYFRFSSDKKITFEIIPVLRIKTPREARNVTDLSFFHVKYVKKNFNARMRKELSLLKKFCRAQKVYGAETYINGFSGYSLECLIIYYKTFKKVLKELVKIKKSERKVIDPVVYFKKKSDAFFELNESKIRGPLVLVDPTWKERNVLAGLSKESFERFQSSAGKFLAGPKEEFFKLKSFNPEKLRMITRRKSAEFVQIALKTDRQEGDIAGTKMKKFSRFLVQEMKKYFDILEDEFVYSGSGKDADFYLVVKSKKETIKIGPPLHFKDAVKKFKAKNKNAFEKNGFLHSREKVNFSAKDFFRKFAGENKKKVKEMGIVGFRII